MRPIVLVLKQGLKILFIEKSGGLFVYLSTDSFEATGESSVFGSPKGV